jgi:hypothetical protein
MRNDERRASCRQRALATFVVLLSISPVTKVTRFSRKRALTATRIPICNRAAVRAGELLGGRENLAEFGVEIKCV